MNPDHPMLQRAQQALARQLNAKRMRVEGELREKQTALQVRAAVDCALQHLGSTCTFAVGTPALIYVLACKMGSC